MIEEKCKEDSKGIHRGDKVIIYHDTRKTVYIKDCIKCGLRVRKVKKKNGGENGINERRLG